MRDLSVRSIPVGDLHEHPANVRRGNVERIMDSLSAHGQYRALVVQASTMRVCAGNHTLAAMRRLGWTHADCHLIDVTDDQARRILLIDNRTSDDATYDYDALAELLTEISGAGDNLTGTGWDLDEFEELIRKTAAGPTPQRETVKAGPGVDDRQPAYALSQTRAIVLAYPNAEYEWVTAMFKRWADDHGTETNPEVLREALAARYPGRP